MNDLNITQVNKYEISDISTLDSRIIFNGRVWKCRGETPAKWNIGDQVEVLRDRVSDKGWFLVKNISQTTEEYFTPNGMQSIEIPGTKKAFKQKTIWRDAIQSVQSIDSTSSRIRTLAVGVLKVKTGECKWECGDILEMKNDRKNRKTLVNVTKRSTAQRFK